MLLSEVSSKYAVIDYLIRCPLLCSKSMRIKVLAKYGLDNLLTVFFCYSLSHRIITKSASYATGKVVINASCQILYIVESHIKPEAHVRPYMAREINNNWGSPRPPCTGLKSTSMRRFKLGNFDLHMIVNRYHKYKSFFKFLIFFDFFNRIQISFLINL